MPGSQLVIGQLSGGTVQPESLLSAARTNFAIMVQVINYHFEQCSGAKFRLISTQNI